MPVEELHVLSKSFQALFNDADYFLSEAKRLKRKLDNDSEYFDQNILSRVRACSRACIIASVAGLESFANSVLEAFKKHDISVLDPEWMNKKHRSRDLEYWPVCEKIRFIPVLCNVEKNPPQDYFAEDNKDLEQLSEYAKIRNSIVHGRVTKIKFNIEIGKDGNHLVDDNLDENKWPITGIHKEVYRLEFGDASSVYTCVISVVKDILIYMNSQVSKRFLLYQEFYPKSQENLAIVRENAEKEPNWYLNIKEKS
ncbi:MAG: hypothetical protein V3V99_07235 [candidate division Zixibacteria bacterium]